MRDTPAGLLSHVQTRRVTTLALCWRITKKDGTIIYGTEHDRNIVIASGDYAGTYLAQFNITGSDIRSSSDLSVDNLDVEGAIAQVVDMSMDVADIESGVMDNCPVVVFQVNWQTPSDGQQVVRAGYIGQIFRDSDSRYKTEVRGLLQKLSQQIGQNYSEECNVVRFGDSRCKFNVASITQSCIVTGVTDRRHFTAEVAVSPATLPTTLPRGGEVQWTSGDNAGFEREVKSMSLAGSVFTVELYEESAADIEVGDGVDIVPGCDRLMATCKFVYDNLPNFRGYGVFVPGALAIMRGNSLQECVVPTLEEPEFPDPPDDDDVSPTPPPITPDPPDDPVPPLPGADDTGDPVDGISGTPDFIIAAGDAVFDGSNAQPDGGGARRRVHGGDLIEIAARNGAGLIMRDVVGEADNFVYVRGPQDGSQAIIRRVNPASQGHVSVFQSCRYVCFDGHSPSAPASGDGRRYALKWMYARNATNTNRDSPSTFIKGSGTEGRGVYNVTRNVIFRNFEVDGGWELSGPRLSDLGIGISTNDHGFKAREFPGQYQTGIIVEHFYAHNLHGEATYIGSNPFKSYRAGGSEGGPGADVPLRDVKIRYATVADCGGNGISGKSWFGGTAGGDGPDENSIHDIVVVRCGFSPDANGDAAISANSCRANIYNIIAMDCHGTGVSSFVSNGTPASISFDIQGYNILTVRNGGDGLNFRQGQQEDGPPLPTPKFRIYNITAVDNDGDGVSMERVQASSWIRNVIAIDNGGTAVKPGQGTKFSTVETGNQNTIFVNPGSDNFHLAIAQPAQGTRGVDYAFKDIEGNDRPTSGADKGAYEKA